MGERAGSRALEWLAVACLKQVVQEWRGPVLTDLVGWPGRARAGGGWLQPILQAMIRGPRYLADFPVQHPEAGALGKQEDHSRVSRVEGREPWAGGQEFWTPVPMLDPLDSFLCLAGCRLTGSLIL